MKRYFRRLLTLLLTVCLLFCAVPAVVDTMGEIALKKENIQKNYQNHKNVSNVWKNIIVF